MNFSLYIDSTYGLRIGLLDESLEFIALEEVKAQKTSQLFQKMIYELLEKKNLRLQDCHEIYLANGPGSYTGLRLGEGLAQILELSGISVFSFYHFEVPQIVGFEDGVYFHNAFKGEWFRYTWKGNEKSNQLVKAVENTKRQKVFFNDIQHQVSEIDEAYFTYDLIKSNSKKLFSYLKENNIREPIYYFRVAENEFKTLDRQGRKA